MKIALDIGGVISKYPDKFRWFMLSIACNWDVYVITDMHDKAEVMQTLKENNIEVPEHRVFCADYVRYGEFCKAVLLKELGIDIFIDDFQGYLSWDSSFGPAPIRLLMMPDVYKPYWAESWKVKTECDFGRRRFVEEKKQKKLW
jgi:hypothetical protein